MRWDQERRRAVGLGCERLRSGIQESAPGCGIREHCRRRPRQPRPGTPAPGPLVSCSLPGQGTCQPPSGAHHQVFARRGAPARQAWGRAEPGIRAARIAGETGVRPVGCADRWVCGLRGPPGVRVARIATYAGRTDHWNRRDEARIRGVASRPRLPRRRGIANRSMGRREAIGPGNRGARPLPFRAHIQPRGRPGPHRRTVPGARPPRHGDREALRGALGVPHRWARRRRDAVRRPNP